MKFVIVGICNFIIFIQLLQSFVLGSVEGIPKHLNAFLEIANQLDRQNWKEIGIAKVSKPRGFSKHRQKFHVDIMKDLIICPADNEMGICKDLANLNAIDAVQSTLSFSFGDYKSLRALLDYHERCETAQFQNQIEGEGEGGEKIEGMVVEEGSKAPSASTLPLSDQVSANIKDATLYSLIEGMKKTLLALYNRIGELAPGSGSSTFEHVFNSNEICFLRLVLHGKAWELPLETQELKYYAHIIKNLNYLLMRSCCRLRIGLTAKSLSLLTDIINRFVINLENMQEEKAKQYIDDLINAIDNKECLSKSWLGIALRQAN